MAAPTNGTIKRLVSEKGFGCSPHDGSESKLLHIRMNGCQFDTSRGTGGTFEQGQGPKGPRAGTFGCKIIRTSPIGGGRQEEGQR